MTPANNQFDFSIQFKPETEEIKEDELKLVLDYLPQIFKEMVQLRDSESEE